MVSKTIFDRVPCLCGLLAAGCLAACGPSPGSIGATVIERDSLGIQILEHRLGTTDRVCPVTGSPVLSIGEADGEAPYLLYRVFDATRLSDGRIAVVNQGSQEIRLYDSDGKYRGAFGREGEGPGEFRRVFQIWTLPGDTMWVGDYRPWRFQVFDPQGNFVRGFEPQPSYLNSPDEMDLLDDGRSVLGIRQIDLSNQEFSPEFMEVVLHSNSGATLEQLGTYSAGSWGQMGEDQMAFWTYPLFESFSYLAAHEDRIALGDGSKPEVQVWVAGDSTRLKQIIRWDADRREVTSRHRDLEEDRYRARYADLDESLLEQQLARAIGPERPARDHFPIFSGLRYGTDGRLWIRAYEAPGDEPGQNWMVFGSDGQFACTATFPDAFEVDEFGVDYVLGESEGDGGTERVVMYSLGTPAAPAIN